MQLDPSNCVLPANRAMALLKKSQYGAAEADCTLALSIDPTYVKVCAMHIAIHDHFLGGHLLFSPLLPSIVFNPRRSFVSRKALQRRASARTGLGKLAQAVTDYDEVFCRD